MAKIQISTAGIKRALKRFNHFQSLAEYIWNGFDAEATCIRISFIRNELGGVNGITISDNGYGIEKSKLEQKFVPFLESEKQIDPSARRTLSNIHGKNGIGRLTFFHFAHVAEWETVYQQESKRLKYSIKITSDNLDTYSETDQIESSNDMVGTKVTFLGVYEDLNGDELKEYLKREFGWFIELHHSRNCMIEVEGKKLDYETLIVDRESFQLTSPGGNLFSINYVQWNDRLNNEFSRHYFLDSNNNEKFSKTTSLNNKGDSFYHSVYIKSDYFDKQQIVEIDEATEDEVLFPADQNYKFLMRELNLYLKRKRKPFLKKYTDKLILDFKQNKAFPTYNVKNLWERSRSYELENLVRELYQVEPKIFAKQNIEQKKTFVRLLDLIMDAGETDKLFEILSEIVDLDTEEREELANLLKGSKLSNIIKTIKLIEDRYKAIDQLKALVFNENLKANERDHLQKFIEKHYWIFGEQYHLVTAAEPKFEEALRRYNYLLTGEDIKVDIDHPDKDKEMDIFAVRQDKINDTITNIVVELKSPTVHLGIKEFTQVEKYISVILSQPEFNASNMKWEFYLVGNRFDTSGFFERQLESAKNHGERSLVAKSIQHKFFVKKWSEIFTEFELKHDYLNNKLQIERDKIIESATTAGEIIGNLDSNSAIQPGQVAIV